MDSNAGGRSLDFAAVVERKAGLKPWEFLVMDAAAFDPAKVRLSVTYLHAAWSAKSAQLLRELRLTLNKLNPEQAPRLVILDADALPAERTEVRFGSAAPEWGDHLWILDGQIHRRFTRHSKAAELQDFLAEFAQLLEARAKGEEPHRAGRQTPSDQSLHELHEVPDSSLRVPQRPSGDGSGFVS